METPLPQAQKPHAKLVIPNDRHHAVKPHSNAKVEHLMRRTLLQQS